MWSIIDISIIIIMNDRFTEFRSKFCNSIRWHLSDIIVLFVLWQRMDIRNMMLAVPYEGNVSVPMDTKRIKWLVGKVSTGIELY